MKKKNWQFVVREACMLGPVLVPASLACAAVACWKASCWPVGAHSSPLGWNEDTQKFEPMPCETRYWGVVKGILLRHGNPRGYHAAAPGVLKGTLLADFRRWSGGSSPSSGSFGTTSFQSCTRAYSCARSAASWTRVSPEHRPDLSCRTQGAGVIERTSLQRHGR